MPCDRLDHEDVIVLGRFTHEPTRPISKQGKTHDQHDEEQVRTLAPLAAQTRAAAIGFAPAPRHHGLSDIWAQSKITCASSAPGVLEPQRHCRQMQGGPRITLEMTATDSDGGRSGRDPSRQLDIADIE